MYKNIVVEKPWGKEYLAYENEHVGLWYLFIKKDQSTSMHCHPRKNTGLVCLDGKITTSFLNDSFESTKLGEYSVLRGKNVSKLTLNNNQIETITKYVFPFEGEENHKVILLLFTAAAI